MFQIAKQFDFCYGHSVHCQLLNPTLSCNSKPKCRHLHGHNGIIKVYLGAGCLNKQQMVLDFNDLNFFKEFVNKVLDHKFIIDKNDSAYAVLILEPLFRLETTPQEIFHQHESGCLVFDESAWNEVLQTAKNHSVELPYTSDEIKRLGELMEGYVIVDFVPTSERLCQWLYEVIVGQLPETHKFLVQAVEFFETPKTRAYYAP